MEKNIFAGSVESTGGSLSGSGEGIYTLCYKDGKLVKQSVIQSRNAGIVCTNKESTVLYAANETKDFAGLNGSGGGVSAYRIEQDGTLTFLNASISYGSRTSYVTVSEDQKYLLATNHGSHSTVTCSYVQDKDGKWKLVRGFDASSLAVFRIQEDGSIGSLTDLKVFEGHGYWCHGGGQSTSHLHCVKERNGLVFCANRGADTIEVLKIQEDGKLTLLKRNHTRPAYAPRHICFHPDKKLLFVVNENYPSVSVYSYEEDGTINEIDMKATMDNSYLEAHPLPCYTKYEADPDEVNTSGMSNFTLAMPSDIHINHAGTVLYVSNRRFKGNGSIAVFRVEEDGTLSLLQVQQLSAGDPRGFNLIDETHLIVGLCDASKVIVYQLDETGKMIREECSAEIASVSSFID